LIEHPTTLLADRFRVLVLVMGILGIVMAAYEFEERLTLVKVSTVGQIRSDAIEDLSLKAADVSARLTAVAASTRAIAHLASTIDPDDADGLAGFRDMLVEFASDLPIVRTILLINRDGVVVADSRQGQSALSFDVSDREYFHYHVRRTDDEVRFFPPIVSRVDEISTWVLSRPIRESDGSLVGVIAVSFDQKSFANVFGPVPSNHAEHYALTDPNGVVLAQQARAMSHDRALEENLDLRVVEGTSLKGLRWEGEDYVVFRHSLTNWPLSLYSMQPWREVMDVVGLETATVRVWGIFAIATILAFTLLLRFNLASLGASHRETASVVERLDHAQNLARIGDFSLDLETKRVSWSQNLYRMLGYTEADLKVMGEMLEGIYHPDDLGRVKEWLVRSIERGLERFPPNEYRVIAKDGRVVKVRAEVRLEKRHGEPRLVHGILQDISVSEEKNIIRETALRKTVYALSGALEARDPYTAGHEKNVAELAHMIGSRMDLGFDQLEGLYLAAMVHDLGKIRVPAEILAKPGRLTDAEFQLICQHPDAGADLLKDVDLKWPIAEIVRQHHERIDGSGYPRGLKGDEICIEARIIAVADTVEAMASHRPYRPGLGIDEAIDEIRNGAGTRYDAVVVEACIKILEEGKFATLTAA